MRAGLDWSGQIEALLAAARPAPGGGLRPALEAVADWDGFLALARRHRLGPLIYRRLREAGAGLAPPGVEAEFQSLYFLSLRRNHLLLRELAGIASRLRSAGIEAVAYKGPLLARMIYGDIALRESLDLDLLIRKRDVEAAHQALRDLGYEPLLKLDGARQRALLRFDYEAPLVHKEEGTLVDLQWASPPRFLSLPAGPDAPDARYQSAALDGGEVATLCAGDLLLVLCSHGAKHAWGRLQWIADVAGIVGAAGDLDWDGLLERARTWRRQRMVLLGLRLAHELLAAPLPERVRELVAGDPQAARLARLARERLFDPQAGELGVGEQTRFLAAAMDSRLDAARFLARLALTPTPGDWEALTLPGWAMWGYYLVRPFRLAGKYVLRRGEREGGIAGDEKP